MSSFHSHIARVSSGIGTIVLALLLSTAGRPAWAQQTIINVPSIDQTPRGQFFALHESVVRTWDPKPYYLSTNFLTYGVHDRLEAAMTLYNVGTYRSPVRALGLGWKTAHPVLPSSLPEWELKVGGGQMVHMSLVGKGVGLWNYAQTSAVLPKIGMRLTAGISAGQRQVFGKNTVHFIGSYELPVTSRVSLLGEWWSGAHEFADFVPGINWHTKRHVVVVGYKFSNLPGTRVDGLILEYGRFF